MREKNASFVDFKRIKQEVSIVQVLDRYGVTEALSKGSIGDRLSGACPLHGGTNKTHFRVSISKNCWNCFGSCHGGGNVLDFVSRKEQISIRDAALLIQEWFALDSKTPLAQPQRPPSVATPRAEEPQSAATESTENKPLAFELKYLDPTHRYLRERGLSEETIRTFGLGYCSKGLLSGRIAIPIHNAEGQLVAYAGRWAGETQSETPKYKQPPGFRKSLEIFNLHRARFESVESPLVIVEGFFDCMALWQNGVRRVVALMGSTMSVEQENMLINIVTSQGRVVVMLDEDEAGVTGRSDILQRLVSALYVKAFSFPPDRDQPDGLTKDDLKTAGLT